FCVEDHERLLPNGSAQGDSAEQFARCALHVGARYAIPFASNHCFLHKETVAFNATATTPEAVRRHYQQLAESAGSQSECVVMPPGSSWSDDGGFDIKAFDFSARREYIEQMLVRHAAQLERCYEQESTAVADFESFRVYFQGLLHALPALVRKRALTRIIFRTSDEQRTHHWLVDPTRGVVLDLPVPPTG